ncbi:replication initiator protein A [Sphingomonas sp. BK580]|uniref:replication initiator protein A n=1 Tax=unclassified Sphingomonas TaxID=196159 RepID=UPI001622DB40|nr:replication initiator protein A [Sphingomonas sp. BK580]MBB3694955.1 plasmid replication initiation protein [Sphingomonas sp. BK580]
MGALTTADNAQLNLLDLDSPLQGKVRGERSIMDYPLFSLAKKPQTEPQVHEIEGISIEIRPSGGGIATMYDKEIVLYAISHINARHRRGERVDNAVVFAAHDFFRATGVSRPSKRDYDRFQEALGRLQGTQIKTNIRTGNAGSKGWFSWFSEAVSTTRRMPDGSDQLEFVKVILCEWLYRAITRDREIYQYHDDYFRLSLYERRLYELAHCYAREDEHEMPIERFAQKIGSSATIKKLKNTLKEIEAEDRIPEYRVELRDIIEDEPAIDSLGRKRKKVRSVVVMRPRKGDSTRMLAA